jgi:hypothetical protein
MTTGWHRNGVFCHVFDPRKQKCPVAYGFSTAAVRAKKWCLMIPRVMVLSKCWGWRQAASRMNLQYSLR